MATEAIAGEVEHDEQQDQADDPNQHIHPQGALVELLN
jgi:hypothetical protein